MDTTIVVAIIGSITTVLSPIITFLFIRYIDNLDKKSISSRDRHTLMASQWQGEIDFGLDDLSSVPIVGNFSATRKTITGQFYVRYPDLPTTSSYKDEFTFQGGFLYERFLRLNYASKNKHRIQFGSIILELSPSGETMSGKFVGYGVFWQQILSGRVDLRRTI